MKLSKETLLAIEQAVRTAVEPYTALTEATAVATDIYMYADTDQAVLTIMDEENEILAQCDIDEWKELDDGGADEHLLRAMSQRLTSLLQKLRDEHVFENVHVMKPYSFVLSDIEGETIIDLLLIDDDTLILGEALLENLDDELNDFLKKLMEE